MKQIMIKRFFLFWVAAMLYVAACAQSLTPITWGAYGLTFKAPKGILIEDDSDYDFLLNNARFYISIHSLESDDMDVNELGELDDVLKTLADEDEVKEQTEIASFDLKQFHGVWLKGLVHEEERCYCACLMTKDAGSVFYISVIYNQVDDGIVKTMLKSFEMEE